MEEFTNLLETEHAFPVDHHDDVHHSRRNTRPVGHAAFRTWRSLREKRLATLLIEDMLNSANDGR